MKLKIFRKLTVAAVMFTLIFSCCSCAKRTVVVPKETAAEPDFETKTGIVIDWDQVQQDCEDQLTQDDYPQSSYIDSAVHEDDMTVELIWVLKETATEEDATRYAEAYMKAFNDAVVTQDFSYTRSTETSYGSFWDKYNANIQVFHESDIMNQGEYMIYRVIKAKSGAPVEAGIDPEVTTDAMENLGGNPDVETQAK